MSAKTKIVVLRMKEIIYTAVFVGLGILLIVLLISMFSGRGNQDEEGGEASYVPGVYTASFVLNNQNVDIAVSVDENHINDIRFTNLSDSVTTMYPLMEPALSNLSEQILKNQSLENITNSDTMKYTETALLQTIKEALDKARISGD